MRHATHRNPRRLTLPLLLVALGLAPPPAASADWQITYPPRFTAPTWLETHQRMCFGVSGKDLDEVIADGTLVICGGTNAAGIGFAGGPFILGKGGEIVDIMSGEPVPDATLSELRARVDAAHAKGAKVLGEVIRFNMTPWITSDTSSIRSMVASR